MKYKNHICMWIGRKEWEERQEEVLGEGSEQQGACGLVDLEQYGLNALPPQWGSVPQWGLVQVMCRRHWSRFVNHLMRKNKRADG